MSSVSLLAVNQLQRVLLLIVDYCFKIFQIFFHIQNVSAVCKEVKPKFIWASVDIIDI